MTMACGCVLRDIPCGRDLSWAPGEAISQEVAEPCRMHEAFARQPQQPVLREALDYDAMRVARNWPTPNHMRTAADALDTLVTPARYGDVLRWFADRCDERVWHIGDPRARERLEAVRAALAHPTSSPEDKE